MYLGLNSLVTYLLHILILQFSKFTRYSNIFVTAPSPENLKTLFQFVFKGFDALEYKVCFMLPIYSNNLSCYFSLYIKRKCRWM